MPCACSACDRAKNGACGCATCAKGMPCSGCEQCSEYRVSPNAQMQVRPRLMSAGMRSGMGQVRGVRVYPSEPRDYQMTAPYAARILAENGIAPAGQVNPSPGVPAPATGAAPSIFEHKLFVPAVVAIALGGTAAIVYNRLSR